MGDKCELNCNQNNDWKKKIENNFAICQNTITKLYQKCLFKSANILEKCDQCINEVKNNNCQIASDWNNQSNFEV